MYEGSQETNTSTHNTPEESLGRPEDNLPLALCELCALKVCCQVRQTRLVVAESDGLPLVHLLHEQRDEGGGAELGEVEEALDEGAEEALASTVVVLHLEQEYLGGDAVGREAVQDAPHELPRDAAAVPRDVGVRVQLPRVLRRDKRDNAVECPSDNMTG